MADVNFPSFSELKNLEFMTPALSIPALDQLDYARKFADQGLQKNQADLEHSTLQNMFDAQNNPLLLQQRQLLNENQGYKNQEDQISARKRAKLEMWETEAAKEDYASKASKSELEQKMSKLEQALVDPDPEVRARASVLYQNTAGMLKQKAANDSRVEAAEAKARSAETIANMREAGATERNNATIAQRQQAAEARLKAASGGKPMNFEQQLGDAQTRWRNAATPEERAAVEDEMRVIQGWMTNKASAGMAGKIDAGAATGMPTVQAPSAVLPSGARPFATPQQNSGLAGGGANDQQNILLQEYNKLLNSPDTGDGRKVRDLAALQNELQRAGYRGQLPGSQAAGQASKPPAAPAIKAPAGRVVVYKDGKPVGSIPESQVEMAKKQGYTIQ